MPSMARMDPFSPPPRCFSARTESLFLDSSPDFGPVKCDVNKLPPIGEMQPIMPQTSFRERSIHLRNLDDDKNVLIDDLIRQLETSQHQLQQLRFDHDQLSKSNSEAQENLENQETIRHELDTIARLLERNSYLTVLIDGDCFTFSKEYLSQGERGGVEAARYLTEAVKGYATINLPDLPTVSIHVKLFANVKRLAESLVRTKFVQTSAICENFLTGFLSHTPKIDVVDTGLAKGQTIKKLMENYRRDYINMHCRQIFLAAPASNTLNALLNETPDVPLEDRITLIEARGLQTNERFDHQVKTLKLDNVLTRIGSENSRLVPPTKVATPILARIDSNSSIRTPNSGATSLNSTPVLSWAAMTAQPFVPKPGEARSQTSTPAAEKTISTSQAKSEKLIPRNKHGQRVDKVDDSIPYQELQRIKKMKLCNIFYLQGKTACDGDCGHSHTYPLKAHEKPILQEVARMTPCYYRTECDDPACIYGHRCPQSKPDKKDCYYKDDCRFAGWGHAIDENVVKIHNVK